MTRTDAAARGLFACATALTLTAGAARAETVTVDLWDRGPGAIGMMQGRMPMGMAMDGAMMGGGGMMMTPMGITATPAAVPAGDVTFAVTNTSGDTVHEMVLAALTDPPQPLPYDAVAQRVDEDAAGHLAEVAELEPGQTGALTLALGPGQYILYCNLPGHYAAGMWTLVMVD